MTPIAERGRSSPEVQLNPSGEGTLTAAIARQYEEHSCQGALYQPPLPVRSMIAVHETVTLGTCAACWLGGAQESDLKLMA